MKRRSKHAAWIGWLTGVWLNPGCTWEPTARPVQPVLIAEGSFEILGMLDTSRHAGVVQDPETNPTIGIVDLRNEERCELPERVFPIGRPMTGPKQGNGEPPFLWPSARFKADAAATLTFSDETCTLYDVDEPVDDPILSVTLDEDKRQVMLFGDGKGKLSYFDPWSNELRTIAAGVSRAPVQAQRPQSSGRPVGPQALWLIESGVLTLRTLDGKVILQRGTAVSEFSQTVISTLRVAFVDDGNLYEAAAPDFTRELIAANACGAVYSGTKISYYAPCADRQLERLNLQTGARETFEKGVYSQWEQNGFKFERARADGKLLLYVTPPGDERTQVIPTLFSEVQPLDSTRIVGVDDQDNFGIWSKREGFKAVLLKTGPVVPFIDVRSNRLSWMAIHQVNQGLGTLSYLEQPSFTLETIATEVATPSVSVLQIAPVSEPVLVYVREASVVLRDNRRASYKGKLDTRVLSGNLASSISDDVTSYTLVPNPNAAGLLYTTQGAKESGLWFAAL